ncbi:MAG TPA: FAD-dependent oxidoreductase [Herpetosiphonaceae bacterium]|nr:FAD-dependent oxidoreductase [Herpetosiphonaceae bacterium]
MYDLAVIGGGSAGITFAKFGARLGARIAVIEADKLGGDCTWTGCVPSKALLHAAHVAQTIRSASRLGIQGELAIDFAAVTAHVRSIQQAIYEHDDSPEVLRKLGATVIEGRGRFRSAEELEVNGRVVRARHYCVCTGSHPRIPDIPGLREAGFITNETIFQLSTLPGRLLVLGGGPIGCELGQAMSRLGSRVTIVHNGPHLLPKDDRALGEALARCFRDEGIAVHCGATAERVEVRDGASHVTLRFGDGSSATVVVDEILVAAGRTPNLGDLGLDVAGVSYDTSKGIAVDEYLRTSNPRVYACGDVIGRYQFTHVAGQEAGLILRNALFPRQSKMGYATIPWATFTDPEVAHVGLNEDEARAKYGSKLRVYEQPWQSNDRARTESSTAGFTKILAAGPRERIVGAHIIGQGAGDLINTVVTAMAAGMSAGKLGGIMHVYPTRTLGVKQTAQQSFNRLLDGGLGRAALRAYFRLFGAKG